MKAAKAFSKFERHPTMSADEAITAKVGRCSLTLSTLKAPVTERLKLTYGDLLLSFAFKFNLHHYTKYTFFALFTNQAWLPIVLYSLIPALDWFPAGAYFSAQPKPCWSHLPVSPCLIDWGEIMHPTYPTKCAYVEPKSGRV
jgi:hypothetical protein